MVNKKSFKIISIITTVFVITTLISLKGLITNATTVASRPEFKIEFDKIRDEALVGEDIVVTGKIKPKPFEVNIDNIDTEIVMVIDKNPKNSNGVGSFSALIPSVSKFIGGLNLKGNVKFGVIDYWRDASVYNDNGNNLIDINKEGKKKNIADYIGGLSINNGNNNNNKKTNTGEALRKAAYLMESPESAGLENKIIILLSNGTPTARTSYVEGSNEINPYVDISKLEYDSTKVKILSDDYQKDMKYSKTIGNIIKEKGYTVYTIGYDTNNYPQAQSDLITIHEAMTGYKLDNTNDYEEKRFYTIGKKFNNEALDLDKIFGLIQKDILESYQINNINMNINFTGDFSLNIGGNAVNLNKINYKLVSKNDGKAIYEADPINFEFVIKGNKEGYQQIFDKLTITYPWKDSTEKVDINSELFITLKSNKLPNIEAKLISDKIVNYSENEIEVKYEIVPKEFEYIGNVNNAQNKEITLIIDTSIDMKALSQLRNGIKNQLINNQKKYIINIITYNSEVKSYIVDPNAKDNNGVPINYKNELEKIIDNIQISNNGERKLGEAIKKAYEIFSENKESNTLKNIIIMAAGDPTDNIPNLSNNKYNIITLALSKNSNYTNPYTKLNEWHKQLGGKDNNYFVSSAKENNNDIESKPSNSNENPLAQNGNIMGEIVKRIDGFNTNSYKFNNITLNFDLASNFDVVSGLQLENESNYIIKLPEIVYTATDNIRDNYYKYVSNPIQIAFKIKPKDGKVGILNFVPNTTILKNYLSYKTLDNEIKKVGIMTPTVIVKEQINNITHGLYNGINGGQISIEKNNNENSFEIAQGSTATFGVSFTFSGSGTEFNLNVDSKFSTLNTSNIKIYKVLKDASGNSTLKELDATNKVIVDNGGNNFKISIKNITDTSTDILVIYQGKIKEDIGAGQTLTNNIVFGSTQTAITIVTPKQSTDSPTLPDLF